LHRRNISITQFADHHNCPRALLLSIISQVTVWALSIEFRGRLDSSSSLQLLPLMVSRHGHTGVLGPKPNSALIDALPKKTGNDIGWTSRIRFFSLKNGTALQ